MYNRLPVIFVPKETREGETRVALTPEVVDKFRSEGYGVFIEKDAGANAGIYNQDYQQVGAEIVNAIKDVSQDIDLILQVKRFEDSKEADFVGMLKPESTIIGFLDPRLPESDHLEIYQSNSVSAFSLELLPRHEITKQYDALSAMSRLSGEIVIDELDRIIDSPHNRVIILALGSLGLAAAERAIEMGMDVTVVSTAARHEHYLSSKGCTYVQVSDPDTYQETVASLLLAAEPSFDVIVCAARKPDGKAPRLLSKEVIQNLPPTTIFDFGATSGGNCEGSMPDRLCMIGHSKVINISGVPKLRPYQSSVMYAKSMYNFVKELYDSNSLGLAFRSCMTCGGLVAPTISADTNEDAFSSMLALRYMGWMDQCNTR